MTTDIANYRETEKRLALTTGGSFFRHDTREARTNGDAPGQRQSGQENGRKEAGANGGGRADMRMLFDMLEHNQLDKEGWQRCMSATVALLKYAHTMLDRADEIITHQSKRITFLEDMATTDELTGLKNRRGFFDAFVIELDRCERGMSEGGLLVLIDLDNFKSINDTHGHPAGDACLRLVARTLENETRVMDMAARLGGDEFVLLLSNTTKGEAASRAQDLAWQLNNLSLAWYGNEIPVRASLGLRSYKGGDTAKKIFSEADIRLYASKRTKAMQPKSGSAQTHRRKKEEAKT